MSNADELLKLKKLLDDGIISQEEFEKKKKELLNSNTNINQRHHLDCNVDTNNIKRERNIITKHPIYSAIVILFILGVIIYCIAQPNQTTPTVSKEKSTSNSTSNNSNTENIISAKDKIKGKDWEISIDSVRFGQKIEPPIKPMFYNYYQVENSSNTYLCLILKCKNISTLELEASTVATVNVKYDNKYTYSSFSTIPDDNLGFTYTNITNIKPLTSNKVYFLAEMPKKIANEKNTHIELNINFENKDYIYKYR